MRLFLVLIVFFSISALASVPARIHLSCSSRSLGFAEIELSQPSSSYASQEVADYVISAKRYDVFGQRLGEATYSIDPHSSSAQATVYLSDRYGSSNPEPVAHVMIPAYGVNWTRHSGECYVKAPAAGLDVTVGLRTGSVYSSKSFGPSFNSYQINPLVRTVIQPGVGSGIAKDMLNGKECPSLSMWKRAGDLSCGREVFP